MIKISCPKCRTENSEDSKFCRECATPLPSVNASTAAPTMTAAMALPELAGGTEFAGRYRIIEELGHGGMGRVYKAFDTKIGEKIALKLVRAEIAADRSVVERFANEIRLARKITHRNVCRMYDLGEDRGTPYITMEYVSGEDLKSMLRMTGGLSPAQTVAMGQQIASGLAEAHRLGVVHRDLKPQNIMIDREGTARIMDFGIAHSARTQGLTDRGAIIGTPDYMSPEQAEAEDVDARSDIYSLGVMLFEMATGKLPFEGRSALALAMKHKSQPPPDPSTLNPRVPPELSGIILKCLAKDRSARYQSADEVGIELARVAGELPATTPVVAHRPATSGTRLSARLRNRTLVLVTTGLLVLALAVAAWFLSSRRDGAHVTSSARPRDSVAVVGFENQTGDVRFDHLRKAIPNLIITSLENTGRFKVTTWERMRDVLKQSGGKDVDVVDAQSGFDVCDHEGIAFIVTGSFTKAGDMFAIDMKLLNAESRALVKSATSRGEGENSILRTQIDEIGREIQRGLAPAPETLVRAPQIIDVTTSSMEAYLAYLRGCDALERFRWESAIKELKRAVELDPEFASAHYSLAKAYGNVSDRIAREREINLAKRYAGKSTERERLFIESWYAWVAQGSWERRVALLKELVERYPREKNGYYELGLAYQNRTMLGEAARALERTLELDPSHGSALNALAFVYQDLGKTDLARQCLEKYVALSPGDGNALDSLADFQMRLGNLEQAIATYHRALSIQPDLGSDLQLAAIEAMKEDYVAAFRWTSSQIEHSSAESGKAEAHGVRAILFQLTGQPMAARAEVERCREILARLGTPFVADTLKGWIEYDNQAWVEARKDFRNARDTILKAGIKQPAILAANDVATVALDQADGKMAEARSGLEKIQRLAAALGTASPLLQLKVRRVQAAALASDGNLDGAVAALTPVWPGPIALSLFNSLIGYWCPLAQDDLARLYVRKNDLDRAIAEYKMLTVIGPAHQNRRLVHPIYHYRLAQVYEKKGMKAEATAEYQRFIKLWEKADSSRPELSDARKRVNP